MVQKPFVVASARSATAAADAPATAVAHPLGLHDSSRCRRIDLHLHPELESDNAATMCVIPQLHLGQQRLERGDGHGVGMAMGCPWQRRMVLFYLHVPRTDRCAGVTPGGLH